MKRFCLCVLLLSLFWGASTAWAEGIAVIINRANPANKLSIAQLSMIYRGQRLFWPDGKQVIVVNRPVDSAVRKVFYQRVLNSKPSQKFHLPGTPIPFRTIIQRSSLATRRFVNNLPQAIGYVYVSEMELDEKNKDIKIIRIIGIGD